MATQLEMGLEALGRTATKHADKIAALVPLARELAARAGHPGITVANLRIAAVQRGLLTGGETGRDLSYLGAVMRKAGLTATGEFRRSHVEGSHGNAHRVWIA